MHMYFSEFLRNSIALLGMNRYTVIFVVVPNNSNSQKTNPTKVRKSCK